MEKHKLTNTDRTIYILLVAMVVCFLVALIQTILFQNRFPVTWSIVLWIIAAIALINGIRLCAMPARFRKKKKGIFQRFNGYLIRNGLICVANYFCYYGVFEIKSYGKKTLVKSIDPAHPRRTKHLQEGEECDIWINPAEPGLCCMNRWTMTITGILEIAAGIAVLALSTMIVIITVS